MINKDSIVTAYDEHLTLVEWLQKVETALKDASAVSFKVNKRGDATLTFSVVFEDGSELETEPITLEQGESVQGATIRNGHLILTLTNGDELDTGNLGGVSSFSIDASQHLIVTYQNGTTQDLGAIFDGATIKMNTLTSDNNEISALKPVVEVMTGYSIIAQTPASLTIENIYCGAVKNGNKLTLVQAFNVTRTGTLLGQYSNTLLFVLPEALRNKLFPVTINNYDVLGIGNVPALDESLNLHSVYSMVGKHNYGAMLRLSNDSLNALTLNEKHYVRIEATFLLSDNLAE